MKASGLIPSSANPAWGPIPSASAPSSFRDVILFHDEVLNTLELDFLSRIPAEQDPISGFDVETRFGFSLAVSGMMMPPICYSPSSSRWTMSRS